MSISRESEEAKNDDYNIPKIIHVIWAGGKLGLPRSGKENIVKWAVFNPEFEVWLWVDRETTPTNVLDRYANLFKEFAVDFKIKSSVVQEDSEQKSDPTIVESIIKRIKLKDVGLENLRNEYIAYEIDKLHPNYGSSSDLLRYKILLKYGGLYVDSTDVYPNKEHPLIESKLFHNLHLNHVLCVDHLSQTPEPKELDLKTFTLDTLVAGKVGNDSFICTQNNPLMKKIIERVEENYNMENINLSTRIRNAHDSKNIKLVTIARTGPGVIGSVLEKYVTEDSLGLSAKFMDGEEKCYVQINAIKNQERQLTISRINNTQNWLYVEMTPYDSQNEVLNAIEKTIVFEAKHFKILRLDDHINDYIASFDKFEAEDKIFHEQWIVELIDRISGINELLQDDLYVQLTGKFQTSINFCKTHDWKSIFSLTEKEFFQAIHYQSSINFMDEFLLPRINLIKDVLILKLKQTTIQIDPERLEIVTKSILSNSWFSFEDFKKIADTIGLSDKEQKSFFDMSDLVEDTRQKLVDTMAQGIVLLEYFASSSEIKINDFETGKRVLNRYAYYGELLNLSVSLNPQTAPPDLPKAQYVPTEKIPDLLVALVEKERLQKAEVISQTSNERPRRGGSCCNVS